MFYPIALLSQVKELKEWMPGVKNIEMLRDISDLRKVFSIQRELAWPMANREFIVCASGVLLKEK
jgi:hypothetical protein